MRISLAGPKLQLYKSSNDTIYINEHFRRNILAVDPGCSGRRITTDSFVVPRPNIGGVPHTQSFIFSAQTMSG